MGDGFHRRNDEINHINTFVLYACIENVASLAEIPTSLHMYCWFVYCTFLNSGDVTASYVELVEVEYFLTTVCLVLILMKTSFLDAIGTFSCRVT